MGRITGQKGGLTPHTRPKNQTASQRSALSLIGTQHGLQRVLGKPFLQSPAQGIGDFGKKMSGSGIGKNVIPNRIVVVTPFDREQLLARFHVAGKGPIGEPVFLDASLFFDYVYYPAGVKRPESELMHR